MSGQRSPGAPFGPQRVRGFEHGDWKGPTLTIMILIVIGIAFAGVMWFIGWIFS